MGAVRKGMEAGLAKAARLEEKAQSLGGTFVPPKGTVGQWEKMRPGREGLCGWRRRDHGTLGEKWVRGPSGGTMAKGCLSAEGRIHWREDSGGDSGQENVRLSGRDPVKNRKAQGSFRAGRLLDALSAGR